MFHFQLSCTSSDKKLPRSAAVACTQGDTAVPCNHGGGGEVTPRIFHLVNHPRVISDVRRREFINQTEPECIFTISMRRYVWIARMAFQKPSKQACYKRSDMVNIFCFTFNAYHKLILLSRNEIFVYQRLA